MVVALSSAAQAGDMATSNVPKRLESSSLETVRALALTGTGAEAISAIQMWSTGRWAMAQVPWELIERVLASPGDPSSQSAWDALVAKAGPGALCAVVRMRDTAGFQEVALRRMAQLAAVVPPIELARWLSDQSAELQQGARRTIRECAERVPDARVLQSLCDVLLLLWWYEDVLAVAERGWTLVRDEAFVERATRAVRRGGLGSCVREKLMRLRASRAERPTRGAELVLWAQVAASADVVDALQGVFRPGDLASLSVRDAAELVKLFHRVGLTKEILQALDDPMQPNLLYLRSWCLRTLGDSVAADEVRAQAWATLTRTVNLDSELILQIGDAMELLGDSEESTRLWTLLVDRAETASVHLVNAYLRLARTAEASGDMALALARCEKALELTRSLGDESARLVAPSGERGTEWLMRTILELRRRVRGSTVGPPESRDVQTSP